MMYAQDYDERTLPYSSLPSGGGERWFILVQPYLKNSDVLKCPLSGSLLASRPAMAELRDWLLRRAPGVSWLHPESRRDDRFLDTRA